MANVRNGTFRESIIDRCLQSRSGYSTKEMFELCNEALERRCEPKITSLNTIRNDIFSIKRQWRVIVEELRNGREIKYRYKNPDFSIFNTPLNEEEIAQLSESVSLLRRFEGMPGFEWVEEMSAHLQTTLSANPDPVIGFDGNKGLKGMNFLTPLFKSITSKHAIKMRYKNYKSGKVIEAVIHPYYLKEYNQRWFLFALDDKYRNISNYALDRIESLGRASIKFIPNTCIDFAHYFDNIVGVSISAQNEIQNINIYVDKEQLPYTLSKPIHKSQRLIEEKDDGGAVISIDVILNFELMQTLLSFGEHIEVLSPKAIREEIYTRIKKNLEKYK